MKFSEMPYERPDKEALMKEIAELTEALRNAKNYEEARTLYRQASTHDVHALLHTPFHRHEG